MSMGFTPINRPRVTPPILQSLDSNSQDLDDPSTPLSESQLWQDSRPSTPQQQALLDRPGAKEPFLSSTLPAHALVQSLPTRPAANESRSPQYLPSRPTLHEPSPTHTLPSRPVVNGSYKPPSRLLEPLSELPAFDRGKLRPSSDVHPMTDWLRELPEEVKLRMDLGKGPNGEPAFSFREWEHQKLSSVSPYVLERLRHAIRRDACDTSSGKRRPNSDIRELLVEWDCNFDDYEDVESWERKHKIPVVFAWLCVRKMRVAINNKKATWLKDLLADEQPLEISNGSEKRPRPVSVIGAPTNTIEIKRMKLENQIPATIVTGFTGIPSMPTPPNDVEPAHTDRQPSELPPK